MTTLNTLTASFDAMAPAIAADFTAWVTRQLDRIITTYPKGQIEKLSASFSHDGGVWRQLRRFTRMVDENGNDTTRWTNLYKIDNARIERAANEYATAQIEAFKAKLLQKLGNLTEVGDLRINGLNFTFRAKLGDKAIYVEQTTVLKCSNKGTLFNQWPCRIYVNGKFTSEAAFKKIAA